MFDLATSYHIISGQRKAEQKRKKRKNHRRELTDPRITKGGWPIGLDNSINADTWENNATRFLIPFRCSFLGQINTTVSVSRRNHLSQRGGESYDRDEVYSSCCVAQSDLSQHIQILDMNSLYSISMTIDAFIQAMPTT